MHSPVHCACSATQPAGAKKQAFFINEPGENGISHEAGGGKDKDSKHRTWHKDKDLYFSHVTTSFKSH